MKSICLVLGANRVALAGPRSKQHRIRQNAKAFASRLREAGFGVRKWTNISNKHFAAVADKMKEQGEGDRRIAKFCLQPVTSAKHTAIHASARPMMYSA